MWKISAHAGEPLDSGERQLLLDDNGESHPLWQYEYPVVHLYEQCFVWCTVLSLPYYEHSMFYLKIEGVVIRTEYRDGVCGICRAGRPLEKKIPLHQEITERELVQYLLLKIHKQQSFNSRDFMIFRISGLDLNTFIFVYVKNTYKDWFPWEFESHHQNRQNTRRAYRTHTSYSSWILNTSCEQPITTFRPSMHLSFQHPLSK